MHRKISIWVMAALFIVALQACGSSGSGGAGSTPTGIAQVSLTDGPGDYGHVYVTVTDIWFHVDGNAGPNDSAWRKYPLPSPKTVDLLALSYGVVGTPVWGNISLPAGTYKQIRIVLAGTEDTLEASAAASSLQYNNEVQIGAGEFPLRVPDARHGIRLAGSFQITDSGKLRLAIDFDAGHDIVDIQRTVNGNMITEYILKPRLGCFDLDNAGAIVTTISPTSAVASARFVFKAEQLNDDGTYHVVKRFTMANPVTGRAVFYPLKPGTYDIVIRGIGYRTMIIKGVPVTAGTTPNSNPTTISTLSMITSSGDYPVDGTIVSPTGAWVNFYQTLPGEGEVPYEIRFRHFNPLTGKFLNFLLSKDPISVGTFTTDTISFAPTTPVEGAGAFSAAAGAVLYSRASYTANNGVITQATGTVSFGSLTPVSPGVNNISGTIFMGMGMGMSGSMNKGLLFAVHGGMIMNTIDVSSQMGSGGSYSMTNLPGGTSANPLPGAVYGVDALGWSSSGMGKAVAVPGIADLRTGNASGVNMSMMAPPF